MSRDDIEADLYAIRQTMMREIDFAYPFRPPSEKSIAALNIGLAKIVDNYQRRRGLKWDTKKKNEIRKTFIANIINLRDIQTSKILTQWQVSVLIDYIKNNNENMEDFLEYVVFGGKRDSRDTQNSQVEVASRQTGDDLSWNEAAMSNMREADIVW